VGLGGATGIGFEASRRTAVGWRSMDNRSEHGRRRRRSGLVVGQPNKVEGRIAGWPFRFVRLLRVVVFVRCFRTIMRIEIWRGVAEELRWLYRIRIDEEVENSIGRCK